MEPITCPSCGSTDIAAHVERHSIGVPLAHPALVDETVYTCGACGESGDFAGTNETAVEEAVALVVRGSVGKMLDDLAVAGISNAYFERTMGLPARTLARWKAGGHCSAAAVALVRTVTTFPWIVEVAEAGFERRSADIAVLTAAGKAAVQLMDAAKVGYQFSVHSTGAGEAKASLTLTRDQAAKVVAADAAVPQIIAVVS